MGPARTFRSDVGRVLAVGMAVVAIAALAATAADGGLAAVVRSGGVPILAATITWALFWRPSFEVSDGGLTVRNVVRTIHVPWPCLRGVATAWSLRLETSDGAFTVWAAPAGGAWGARRPDAARAAGAEAAAAVIEERWAALRDAGYLDARPRQAVHPTITWHTGTIAAATVLAAWSWWGAALG